MKDERARPADCAGFKIDPYTISDNNSRKAIGEHDWQ